MEREGRGRRPPPCAAARPWSIGPTIPSAASPSTALEGHDRAPCHGADRAIDVESGSHDPVQAGLDPPDVVAAEGLTLVLLSGGRTKGRRGRSGQVRAAPIARSDGPLRARKAVTPFSQHGVCQCVSSAGRAPTTNDPSPGRLRLRSGLRSRPTSVMRRRAARSCRARGVTPSRSEAVADAAAGLMERHVDRDIGGRVADLPEPGALAAARGWIEAAKSPSSQRSRQRRAVRSSSGGRRSSTGPGPTWRRAICSTRCLSSRTLPGYRGGTGGARRPDRGAAPCRRAARGSGARGPGRRPGARAAAADGQRHGAIR